MCKILIYIFPFTLGFFGCSSNMVPNFQGTNETQIQRFTTCYWKYYIGNVSTIDGGKELSSILYQPGVTLTSLVFKLNVDSTVFFKSGADAKFRYELGKWWFNKKDSIVNIDFGKTSSLPKIEGRLKYIHVGSMAIKQENLVNVFDSTIKKQSNAIQVITLGFEEYTTP